MPTLASLTRTHRLGGAAVKPPSIFEIYQGYFPPQDAPVTLLELGVYQGDSLRVLASYFEQGRIIGVDLARPGPDFKDYPNIIYESADQADQARLAQITETHAPDGYDIIIDDAAHIGHLAQASYTFLFPHVKPGGLYIVEDWGTGYYEDWPDGGPYQDARAEEKRVVSHDYGMVGFVKSLVDDTAGDHLRPTVGGPLTRNDTIEFMHVYKTCVIIKKSVSMPGAPLPCPSARGHAV